MQVAMFSTLLDKLINLAIYLTMGWLFYQLLIAPNGMRLMIQLKQLESQQQGILQEIKQEEQSVMHKKLALQKDPIYLAFEARKDWAFVKPNEKRVSLMNFTDKDGDM